MGLVTFTKLGQLGRLGNQLFQIASTIGIAKKNEMAYVFPEQPWFKYLQNPPRSIEAILPLKWQGELNHHYDDYKLDTDVDYDLHGFFQSPKYWQHCENFILQTFEPKSELVEKIKFKYPVISEDNNTVSVHIRRTDYLTQPENFVDLSVSDHYKKAKEHFGDNATFVFFSDDIAWTKNEIGRKQDRHFQFIQDNDPIIDLFLMSHCKHNIIANSSFSWWAAYLNKNKNKKVIYPKNWFGPHLAKDHSIKDMMPEGWIGIDNNCRLK